MNYSVRDWERHFEVAQSRRIKGELKWLPFPTKHDGKSYRRLIRLPNGPAIYGAWCLILAVCTKCTVRGVLADEDGDLTAADLEAKTGCPEGVFAEALQVLSSKEIGWIINSDARSTVDERSRCSEHGRPTRPYRTEHNRTEHDITEDGNASKNDAPASEKQTLLAVAIPECLDTPAFRVAWGEWIAYRRERRASSRPVTLGKQLQALSPLGPADAARCIEESICNGWIGLFPEKSKHAGGKPIRGDRTGIEYADEERQF